MAPYIKGIQLLLKSSTLLVLSASTGLLAILFVSSRRLHNVCLRFRSVLPIVLFSSRRYGCIYAIRRLSPCGIGSLVSHKSSGFALLIVSFRLSASAAGASRYWGIHSSLLTTCHQVVPDVVQGHLLQYGGSHRRVNHRQLLLRPSHSLSCWDNPQLHGAYPAGVGWRNRIPTKAASTGLIVEYECIMAIFTLSLWTTQVWAIYVNSIKGNCPKIVTI